MEQASDLQVMQEVMRGVLLALCLSAQVDRAKLAHALTSFSAHPGLDVRSQACLQDLAEGMTAIAPSGGRPQ